MLLEVLAEEGEHPLPCVGGGLLVLAESGDTCQCVEGSTVGEAVPRMGVGLMSCGMCFSVKLLQVVVRCPG